MIQTVINLLLATATVVSAIAAWGAVYVAKQGIITSVVSARRQARIASLQMALSEFIGKEQIARILNRQGAADGNSLIRIEQIVCLNHLVELLIDPTEDDDKRLIEMITKITNTINHTTTAFESDESINQLREEIVKVSHVIFAREFERAKCGR